MGPNFSLTVLQLGLLAISPLFSNAYRFFLIIYLFHHVLNIDVSFPSKSFLLTFFFAFFEEKRKTTVYLYFIRQIAQKPSSICSEMLRFKRVRDNGDFGGIIIVSLFFTQRLTSFVFLFNRQVYEIEFTRKKKSSFPGLLQLCDSAP